MLGDIFGDTMNDAMFTPDEDSTSSSVQEGDVIFNTDPDVLFDTDPDTTF